MNCDGHEILLLRGVVLVDVPNPVVGGTKAELVRFDEGVVVDGWGWGLMWLGLRMRVLKVFVVVARWL